jgi:hypothetical protein
MGELSIGYGVGVIKRFSPPYITGREGGEA